MGLPTLPCPTVVPSLSVEPFSRTGNTDYDTESDRFSLLLAMLVEAGAISPEEAQAALFVVSAREEERRKDKPPPRPPRPGSSLFGLPDAPPAPLLAYIDLESPSTGAIGAGPEHDASDATGPEVEDARHQIGYLSTQKSRELGVNIKRYERSESFRASARKSSRYPERRIKARPISPMIGQGRKFSFEEGVADEFQVSVPSVSAPDPPPAQETEPSTASFWNHGSAHPAGATTTSPAQTPDGAMEPSSPVNDEKTPQVPAPPPIFGDPNETSFLYSPSLSDVLGDQSDGSGSAYSGRDSDAMSDFNLALSEAATAPTSPPTSGVDATTKPSLFENSRPPLGAQHGFPEEDDEQTARCFGFLHERAVIVARAWQGPGK